MHKISAVIFAMVMSLVSPAYGFSVAPMIEHNVEPSTAEKFGIQVHVLNDAMTCNGTRFYISAPIAANGMWLQFKNIASNEIVTDIQSGLLELPPYPEADKAWLANSKSKFLSNGFRGIHVCLNKESISRMILRFTSKRELWNIKALSQWDAGED
jgi:hypothetical protein